MAAMLSKFYDQVDKELGLEGRMKLAMLTGISSTRASSEPDSPENVSKFEKAINQLRGGKS